MATPPSDLRHRLRPGCQVVRHDEATLAVVLGAEVCPVEDTSAVRAALHAWQHGIAPTPSTATDTPCVERATRDLLARDWLVTPSLFRGWPTDPIARAAEAASLARDGSAHAVRRERRTATAVRVVAPPDWRETAEALVTATGLTVAGDQADAHLVLTAGEPSRHLSDDLVRTGQVHLFVTVLVDGMRIGPWVRPGVTACLRCVDAGRAVPEPTWPLRALQLGEASEPEAVDPTLVHVGLGWAVRDLAAWAAGEKPGTWSGTAHVSAALEVRRERHLRHPHCGCAWDVLDGLTG